MPSVHVMLNHPVDGLPCQVSEHDGGQMIVNIAIARKLVTIANAIIKTGILWQLQRNG